jgi:hypothetical protein
VGVSGQLWDYPSYIGPPPGWQKYNYGPHPHGVKARVAAVAPLVHPAWSEVIVAQILAGVINDGGGWIESTQMTQEFICRCLVRVSATATHPILKLPGRAALHRASRSSLSKCDSSRAEYSRS